MNICVFCASADGIEEVYFEDARRLGNQIGDRNWTLVYGGTNCGLMKEVARATIVRGGKAIGVIPECIQARGVVAVDASELLIAPDMKERKRMLRERADAFIALPGGWGTLEEITEVITLKQLGCHNKPVVFVNTGGFYDLFFKFIRDIRSKGFISPAYDSLYKVVDTIEEAVEYAGKYKAEAMSDKYGMN